MANKDTKNNVSGKPPMTGSYGRGSGGGTNTAAFVRNARGGAPGNGEFVHGGLGDQNQGYGDGQKWPVKLSAEVALENNKDGGAVQRSVSATGGDKRTRVSDDK